MGNQEAMLTVRSTWQAIMNMVALEIFKTAIQLILLGIVGGGVGFLYSKRQKTREQRIATLQRLATSKVRPCIAPAFVRS